MFVLFRMMLLCLLVCIQLFAERTALFSCGWFAQFCVNDAFCFSQQLRTIMLAIGFLQALGNAFPVLSTNGSALCLYCREISSVYLSQCCIVVSTGVILLR